MIDKLTPEQEAKFPDYVSRWLEIGLSTAPVDFEKAKEAVCQVYESANLPRPTQFFVADSPLDAIRIIKEIDSSMSDSDILSEMAYNNHEAPLLAFYQFFKDEVGIEACQRLAPHMELAKHCGWLSMYEDVVVFQHRPEQIKMDDQNRLHCENGPAIRFRDGMSIYAWHGVTIPDEWIEHPADLTPKTALTWVNIEQRRCACEILGWARILRELNAHVIDNDVDPEIGTLVEVEIPHIGKERFLKVLCGTGREFALPVPPDVKTALEANAWTYNLDPKELLNLEVRT